MHARLRRIMPGAAPADWPNDAGLVGPGRGPGSRASAGLDYRCTTMRGGGCGLWKGRPPPIRKRIAHVQQTQKIALTNAKAIGIYFGGCGDRI